MVKLINKTTGTPMWVADERVDEYLKAGHKNPADTPKAKPAEETVKPVKKASKKG